MLIPNKTWCSGSPLNVNFGERSQSGFRTETSMNKYFGDAFMAKSAGIPSTSGFHYGWGKIISNIGFTPNNTIYAYLGTYLDGNGSINFSNLAGIKRATSAISGTSYIGVANKVSINAIAKLSSDIAGLAAVNADIAALVNMVAAINGTSDLIAALGGISSAVCAIVGSSTVSSDITGSALLSSDIIGESVVDADIIGSVYITATILAAAILNGDIDAEAFMSADITVGAQVDPLSPTALATAVWNSVAEDFNNANTMGEKLNASGEGGETIENIWTRVQKLLKLGDFIALK